MLRGSKRSFEDRLEGLWNIDTGIGCVLGAEFLVRNFQTFPRDFEKFQAMFCLNARLPTDPSAMTYQIMSCSS